MAEPSPEALPDRLRTGTSLEYWVDAWDELGITGENWRERLDTIDPAARPQMAMSLLRGGGFDCPEQPAPPGTCAPPATLREAKQESTLTDPCLRRLLALWAIDQLSDDDLYLMFDELTELVELGPPEVALATAVLERFVTGFEAVQLRWVAEFAGHEELPDINVVSSLSEDELRRAARDLHYDAAVIALDARVELELYLYALDDTNLQLDTRLEVMERLAGAYPDLDEDQQISIRMALRWTSRNGDCLEAAIATKLLSTLRGGSGIVLHSGPFDSEAGVVAATCAGLAMGVRGSAWKQVISKQGIEVAAEREDPFRVDALWTKYPFAYDHDLDGAPDVPEADPDGDGNVATTREETTRRWHKRFTLPYADELKLALPHCKDNICKVPDSTVWFELDIARERGTKLRLRGIERHERVGSDC